MFLCLLPVGDAGGEIQSFLWLPLLQLGCVEGSCDTCGMAAHSPVLLSHPILSPPSPAEAEDIKVCPRCSAFIMKINDGSCNRMNCTVCGCLFCWLCLREISDVHFLRSVQGQEGSQALPQLWAEL